MNKFNETQRFTQVWLKVIILIFPIFILVLNLNDIKEIINQVQTNIPLSETQIQKLWSIATMLLVGFIGSIFLLVITKLKIWILNDVLYVQFIPFHFSPKKYNLSSIVSAEAIKYSPIKDFGGWGIKYGFKGKIYNISGNKAVELHFKNGKKLFLGSLKSEELAEALKTSQ